MLGMGYTNSESPIETEQAVDLRLDCADQGSMVTSGRMVTSAESSTEDGECTSSGDGG